MDDLSPTKLEYYDHMWKLQSQAKLLSHYKGDDGRLALILDSTVFYPQGGGQPSDTGFITIADSATKFLVQDVRSKQGIVYHYGVFVENENSDGEVELKLESGTNVLLFVDEPRRMLNTRLHSAGHLLDMCMLNVGLGYLEPGKGYDFPDGPYVEYKGTIPQSELQSKQKELELEVNAQISKGEKITADICSYEEAAELCGGCLPDYIPMGSTPRIVKFGKSPGCPCGGTHVSDVSEIISVKVSQIRTKKGMTKVFYNVG
ncbi:uncharacterized protein [Rutidosis leptorrhynchoides]|uniref:uncharacterized protein n=1 Tax=Rutidosis leptorrhynchoides TaxID=125765 RepID=UPI003A9935F0